MKIIKKAIPVLLIVAMCVCITVSAFASDQYFYFNLANTGQTAYVYTATYNTKWYSNQNATLKVSYNNANSGYGYRLALVNTSYTRCTYPLWFTSTSSTAHPAYYSGMGVAGMNYYASGRIDDQLSGTYTCYGYFNSDYT